jgi:hypothetical protein
LAFHCTGKTDGDLRSVQRPHVRDELLNETILYDLDHTRSTLARWAAAYNQKPPHSALLYLTPAGFAGAFTATGARLRNPDHMWTAPWQALFDVTALWRLLSYVRPVDASSRPAGQMISASQVSHQLHALEAPVGVRNVLVCGSPGVHHLISHWQRLRRRAKLSGLPAHMRELSSFRAESRLSS